MFNIWKSTGNEYIKVYINNRTMANSRVINALKTCFTKEKRNKQNYNAQSIQCFCAYIL